MPYRVPSLPKAIQPRWETPDPPRVAGSYGPEVVSWARHELGLSFDRWQAYAITKALRHDPTGHLVHRVALISTGRQNGKSVIIRAFYDWLFDVGRDREPFCHWRLILAAAHDAKQARIIYRGVYDDLATIPRLTRKPPRTPGERADWPPIRLTRQLGIEAEGLTFDTITREPGSARGVSAGAIAFDEVLTQRDWEMWEAVGPTQRAQVSPILLLTSTAGHPDSVVLRAYYDRLRRQASGDEKPDPTFYGAWWESEDPDAGLDWRQIAQANPSLPEGRLDRVGIRGEFDLYPRDSWQRERLNHFVDVVVSGAFNPGVWAACRTAEPLRDARGPFTLGIDIQPGWDRATIAVAGTRPDGRIGVEVYRDVAASDATPITAAMVIESVERFPDIDMVQTICYDSISGAAAAFERNAQESGLPWEAQRPHEIVAGCMDVTEMILSGHLAVDDPRLDAQIPSVARRPVGQDGAFRFSRQHSSGPIDAVMAMILAAHGNATAAPMPRIT